MVANKALDELVELMVADEAIEAILIDKAIVAGKAKANKAI